MATFYSDLATLDSTIPISSDSVETDFTLSNANVVQLTTENIDIEQSQCSTVNNEENVIKRKKKKTKKSEPWRTGNLENWINKWQKAQRELND